MDPLPRLLADFRAATGLIKQDYEDFQVDEIPLYDPLDDGPHTFFLLEKRGLSSLQAANDVAAAVGVGRRDIGIAGMKDAKAVTRQWMSVEHVPPERLLAIELPRIRILEARRHRNKLRIGHLRGNRFLIRVRQTETERLAELQKALARLSRLGVPNLFGRQRFGGRGDAWEVGRAIVRGRLDEALDIMLGRADDRDRQDILRARKHYDAGAYEEAIRAWPGLFREERRALRTLARTGKKKRAFLAVDPRVRNFYVSAAQSQLFNETLIARMSRGLHRLLPGDLAFLHDSGAVFEVIDVAVEQPRADAFEISPSGPLFGFRMSQPSGEPGEIEARVLREADLEPSAFRAHQLRVKGARRPLRFPVFDASISLGADGRGAYLELAFALPRGCYATSLLRELFTEQPLGGESLELGGTEFTDE